MLSERSRRARIWGWGRGGPGVSGDKRNLISLLWTGEPERNFSFLYKWEQLHKGVLSYDLKEE